MDKLKYTVLFLIFLNHVVICQHFLPVTPTGKYCPIIIQDAKISGIRIFPGDEIAVFNDTLCVGSTSYIGSFPASFSASMKVILPNSTILPGAVEQDSMIFKIYQVSSGQELQAKAYYETGGIFYEGLPTVVPLLEAFELHPPLADAGGPYTGYEGSPICFDGSNSSDSDGHILLYEWDWDHNGLFDVSTIIDTISNTWFDDHVGIVALQIYDNDNMSDQDDASVVVLNVSPIVDAGPNIFTTPNILFSLDSALFRDPGLLNDSYDITIDWGDGNSEPSFFQQVSDYFQISAEHQYQQAGSYIVKIQVNDEDGGIGQDSLTVFVEDAKPSINLPILSIPEDDSLEISLTDINFYIVDNRYTLSELTILFLGDTSHYDYNFDITTGLVLWPTPENWNGVCNLILTVENPLGYSCSDTTQVTVTPINDFPKPFDLISPSDSTHINDLRKSTENQMKSIHFIWSQSENVDKINGDSIVYEFYLGVDPLPENNRLMTTTSDTSYDYESGDQMGSNCYFWSVKAKDNHNSFIWASHTWSLINITSVQDQNGPSIPETFKLYPNYPNPFNPETNITYEIPTKGWVHIKIYNTQGQLIRSLVNQEQSFGNHNMIWNGLDEYGKPVSCGLYIYSVSYNNHLHLNKMMLIK